MDAHTIMVLDSTTQVVIKASIDDRWLVLIAHVAKSIMFTGASLLIQVHLVSNRAKLLKLVFAF